jgi:hypothetical protein
MKRETFALLLDIVRPHISGNDLMSNARAPVDAETRLATALYWYATGQTYRHIGDLFGISTQSVSNFCNIVSRAIVTHVVPQQIRFPESLQQIRELAQLCQVNSQYSLPNCIGAIDGTHIRVLAQPDFTIQWRNYKGFYSVQLLAAVDYRARFLCYDFGLPGSSHDAYVLRTSRFFEMMSSGEMMDKMWTDYAIPLQNVIVPPFFLGDAAFPLLPWLMKGYGGRGEAHFDFWLSSARMIVEKAFGILKNRFRLLLDCRIRVKMVDIAYHVPAILALHNFCINNGDEFVGNWEENYQHDDEAQRGELRFNGNIPSRNSQAYAKKIRNVLKDWANATFTRLGAAAPA